MFRVFIDQLMGGPLVIGILLAHAAALVWALVLHKGMAPALVLNLVLSAAIVAYNADHLVVMLQYADYAPLALMVFAAAAFVCAAAALYGLLIPTWINWTIFAVNFGLSILLLVFMLTFKINRLI